MDILTLRWSVAVLAPLVLVSYVVGFLRADDPEALWGGIDGGLRTATVPFMFLAAAGFLGAAYLVFLHWTPQQVAALHWPWGADDGHGVRRLWLAYVLYLAPSALWLEATLLHLHHGAAWSQVLVIGVLSLVTVGLLLFGALAVGAVRDGLPGAPWLVVAVVVMMVQSTVNDNIVWVWKFPW